MAAHTVQEFIGVSNIASYLGNIKIFAESVGWITDKDKITDDGELYIHSLGLNGKQNLYFSFKIRADLSDPTKTYLVWHCNTGFDDELAWDNQPGKFSVLPNRYDHHEDADWGGDWAHWIQEPCPNQILMGNAQDIICVQRLVFTIYNGTVLVGYSMFVIGAMDSTLGAEETELNFTMGSPWGWRGGLGLMLQPYMRLPKYQSYSSSYRYTIQPYGLLYNGEPAITLPPEDSHGYVGECPKAFYSSIGTYTTFGHLTSDYRIYSPHPVQRGVDYSPLLLTNPGMARTVLHKPFITVEDQRTDVHYCYPIRASLPYYACAVQPYVKAEEVVSLGSRYFKVFPLLNDVDKIGIAIEVNV